MSRVNDISHLSYEDHIELRSTLHALSNKDFQCNYCQSKYPKDTDYDRTMMEALRSRNVCREVKPKSFLKVVQDNFSLSYSTCIGNFFSESCLAWINSYNHFEKGVMPFTGGYMDQPSKFLDVMSVVGNHKAHELMKEQERRRLQEKANRGR